MNVDKCIHTHAFYDMAIAPAKHAKHGVVYISTTPLLLIRSLEAGKGIVLVKEEEKFFPL